MRTRWTRSRVIVVAASAAALIMENMARVSSGKSRGQGVVTRGSTEGRIVNQVTGRSYMK